MTDIVAKYGTGGQTLTLTLAGLTNNSVRASTAVDNSTTKYQDALVSLKIKTGASGVSSTGIVEVYAFASVNGGTTYTDGATGTDAAVTLTNPTNMQLIGIINCVASATTYYGGPFSVADAFGKRLPEYWGIATKNVTAATLDATAGNHAAIWQGVALQTA